MRQLAERYGVDLPENIRFHKGMGLGPALARFAVTLSVLQEPPAVRQVAAEICDDSQQEGVTTLEIRFAPQLHLGAPMEAIVDAALDGIGGRAGLILCGLYGEPPELIERLVDIAAARPGAVGIDLAGSPQTAHDWTLSDYAPAFIKARQLGLGRTVHAVEGRPAQEIRQAIVELDAQRIGHGTTLLDDPVARDLVLERGVVLEACPTSNVHTGAVDEVDRHPLPNWLAHGVKVCINTDNTLLSDVDAPTEYRRAADIPGMPDDGLAVCLATGHAAAFRR